MLDGKPVPLREFIEMSDPAAPAHILSDISDTVESGSWRWTEDRPALLFVVPRRDGWRLLVEFAIAESTFRETGAFHITFRVNNHVLDKVRYDSVGQKRFEKPVPSGWLQAGSENLVVAEIDKVYVAEADKRKLGVVLTRAGFVR